MPRLPELPELTEQWAEMFLRLLIRDPYGVRAEITDTIRGPRVLAFMLRLQEPSQLRTLQPLGEVIALTLSMVNPRVPIPACRIGRVGGWVAVELSLPRPYQRTLTLDAMPRYHGFGAPLGLGMDNQPAVIRFDDPLTPHLLVVGRTGAGKSTAVQALLVQLLQQMKPEAMRLLLIDHKAEGLLGFAGVPHLIHGLITDAEEAARALEWLVSELHRRRARRMAGDDIGAPILTVIDEVASVLELTGGRNGAAAKALALVLAQGRSSGLHLVIGTQHPTTDVLGGALGKANIPARWVGAVSTVDASTVACGSGGHQAHMLSGSGDALYIAGGEATRIQTPLPSKEAFDRLPRVPIEDQFDLGEIDAVDLGLPAVSLNNQGQSKADPLTPRQIAWALAQQSKDGKPAARVPTCNALGIGDTKAKRLLAHADEITRELGRLGCKICWSTREAKAPHHHTTNGIASATGSETVPAPSGVMVWEKG